MKFNQTFYKKHGYKVTDEAINRYLSKELTSIIEAFQPILTGMSFIPTKIVVELEGLVKRYPEVLSFTNFLYIAYHKNGQEKKAIKYLHETVNKYPDYLFGVTNLANYYIAENQFDRAAGLLKEPFDIRNIEKDDIIHETAFLGYYYSALRVEIKRNNLKNAETIHRLLFDYDPKNKEVKVLAKELLAARAANFPNIEAPKNREIVTVSKPIGGQYLSDAKGQPIFNHQEINQLYHYGLESIPKAVIETILALPRQTLIQDLEHVLCDTVLRNNYFVESDNWSDETHQFTIHALYLLTELKSYDSLRCILDVLRQDSEFSEYWFADWIEDFFNAPIYILGQNQLDVLKMFVLEGNVFAWHRLLATNTVAQVALKQPERRKEAIEWCREVIRYHLDNPKNNNLIDSDFLGMFVNDLLAMKAIELKEDITKLYATGWVSNFDAGPIQEVLAELELPIDPQDIKPLSKDIFELYNRKDQNGTTLAQKTEPVKEGLAELPKLFDDPYDKYMRDLTANILEKGYEDDDDDEYQERRSQLPLKREEPKVGRNDPCPCGSGKKYKKCHGQ